MTIPRNKSITKQLNSYSYIIAITLQGLLQRTKCILNVYSLLLHKWWVPLYILINETHHLCDKKKYAFNVLPKYSIITHLKGYIDNKYFILFFFLERKLTISLTLLKALHSIRRALFGPDQVSSLLINTWC